MVWASVWFLFSVCSAPRATAYYGGSKQVWDFRGHATVQDRMIGEAPDGEFGSVVATVDLISVVGSPSYQSADGKTGAVFVYRRKSKSSHEWIEEDFIVADDGAEGDLFGGAVAVSGGILLVGSMHNSEVMSQAGAVYAFQRSITVHEDRTWTIGWNQLAKLAPEELLSQDYFGCSVAIHKNISVIGAKGRDDGGTLSGAAYVYRVNFDEYGDVEFEFDEKILAEDPTRYDWFGTSVGVHDNYIIIGAPGVDYNGNPRSGAAYIFHNVYSKDAEDYYMWIEMEMLVVSDGGAEDMFGDAVAISDSIAVVGAEGSAHGSHAESGAAFVFTYNQAQWKYSHTLTTPDEGFEDLTGFGHSVTIYKDTIAVTAHSDSGPGGVFGYNLVEPDKGLFLWQHAFSRLASAVDAASGFGSSVSLFDDCLVVGAPDSKFGALITFLSNTTVDAYSFIPEEEEYFMDDFSLPDAAVALFTISGTVLAVFMFVRYGGAVKKCFSREGSSGYPGGDRGSLVAYDDVDLDSEHSTRSIGLTEVEHHTFSSRNPLNNRF